MVRDGPGPGDLAVEPFFALWERFEAERREHVIELEQDIVGGENEVLDKVPSNWGEHRLRAPFFPGCGIWMARSSRNSCASSLTSLLAASPQESGHNSRNSWKTGRPRPRLTAIPNCWKPGNSSIGSWEPVPKSITS